MNIPAIKILNQMNIYDSCKQHDTGCRSYNHNFSLTQPLAHDTVTFSGKYKKAKSLKQGIKKLTETVGTPKELIIGKKGDTSNIAVEFSDVPMDMAKKVYKAAKPEQIKIDNYIKDLFQDMLVTKYNPQNAIVEIKGRVKSDFSIREKALTRKWFTKDKILKNMTDLNGEKIILRDGKRECVHGVLERIIKEIEAGRLELVEIENKRPIITKSMEGREALKYDYTEIEVLDKMVNCMKKKHPKKRVLYKPVDYTESNYPGLHFLFKFPKAERCFEVQLMGYDVALYKDLDDIIYKILGNKKVDPKYDRIVEKIKKLNEPQNAEIKEGFNKYRSNVFYIQRRKAPHIRCDEKYTEYFLPISDEITDDYFRDILDMNNLYKEYLKCIGK